MPDDNSGRDGRLRKASEHKHAQALETIDSGISLVPSSTRVEVAIDATIVPGASDIRVVAPKRIAGRRGNPFPPGHKPPPAGHDVALCHP